MENNQITLSSLAQIDWEHIYKQPWHLDIDEQPKEKHGIEYWNNRAKTMYEGEDYYAERAMAFLKFADVPAGSSVIDIASGIGALTIPLLDKECKVTAIDISDYSLNILSENCKKNKANLNIVNGYFREVADKLQPCDYVLNFYSLGVICLDRNGTPDLADTLIKMNNLARKKIVITMPANEENDIATVFKNS